MASLPDETATDARELHMQHPRAHTRTPSPTPSEQAALDEFRPKRFKDMFKRDKRQKQEGAWKGLLIILVLVAIITLLIVFNSQIVHGLQPAANWMHRTPGGWLIPIAVLIILSFPPLLGHEIVLILVGFTWGLGVGAGIAFAGTLIGEIITFYVFKYFYSDRQPQWEAKDARYACLSRVVRHGGWWMATVVRYSSIPGHVSTALFAVIGISLWSFLVAAVLALPKQLATVALGYVLARSGSGPDGRTKEFTIVQVVVIVVTTVVTIGVSHYLRSRRGAIVEQVVYERRKERQSRTLQRAGNEPGKTPEEV